MFTLDRKYRRKAFQIYTFVKYGRKPGWDVHVDLYRHKHRQTSAAMCTENDHQGFNDPRSTGLVKLRQAKDVLTEGNHLQGINMEGFLIPKT